MERPTIPEYFSGKNIFITGGTGFIGKVLIEKILRSCPDVGKIFLLIRPKKEKMAAERINDMTKLPLFDELRQRFPENLKKIEIVDGDVAEVNLGMTKEDRQKIIDEANIVYHAAASVRFDDSLKKAIFMNTRGTLEVVKLAKNIKHLSVFVHLSTVYANSDQSVLDEIMYPPHADWKTSIELAETCDPQTLEVFTEKFIFPLPNTYTFTKSMADDLVKELCDKEIPTIIIRPSIVVSTLDDPFPGWIDNFNGPAGLLVASGKGILRTSYADCNHVSDYIPCDTLVKTIIIATWDKGAKEDPHMKRQLSVINGCVDLKLVTVSELIDLAKKIDDKIPLNNAIWIPGGDATNCWYKFYILTILYQLIPAILLDGLLLILGKQPLLVRLNRKIFIANQALTYFITRHWKIVKTKSRELQQKLKANDVQKFYYKRNTENTLPEEFFKNCVLGGRRHLLKQSDETLPQAKTHRLRLRILSKIFNTIWYIGVLLLLKYTVEKYYLPIIQYVQRL